MRRLGDFTQNRLPGYNERRNQPDLEFVSHMSPYLHFGQLSPLQVALEVQHADAPKEDRDAYLEELIVRRELACNYVHFTPRYDRFEALPDWARGTLTRHAADRRPATYTSLLECRYARDGRNRVHAQLHAHVLGQEVARVVPDSRAGLLHRPFS
jgi:deoxyribodipyrimidine photo-lyase